MTADAGPKSESPGDFYAFFRDATKTDDAYIVEAMKEEVLMQSLYDVH